MNTNTILIIFLIPIISALIGWFTNYIAIKSLFRPYIPINILGFKFQGVLSKRRAKLAKKIAKVVSEYLFSVEDIKSKISKPKNISKLKTSLIKVVSINILGNLPVMIKPMAEPMVKNILEKEGEHIIIALVEEFVKHLESDMDIEQLVEEKLLNYDIKNLETIVMGIARDEFRHIELLGAIIGFIVGLFQILLFVVLN
jgi:uncharacterized membrane protein YheB (UPF0754 family)